LWLNKRAEKVRKIQDYRDEIRDYLPWQELEASYRITGIIRRLNRLGVSDIYLIRAYLPGVDLRGTNLQKAILVKANLRGAVLNVIDFQGAALAWISTEGDSPKDLAPQP